MIDIIIGGIISSFIGVALLDQIKSYRMIQFTNPRYLGWHQYHEYSFEIIGTGELQIEVFPEECRQYISDPGTFSYALIKIRSPKTKDTDKSIFEFEIKVTKKAIIPVHKTMIVRIDDSRTNIIIRSGPSFFYQPVNKQLS